MITDDTPHEPTGPVEDDRLRLIFTCCHPALAPEARVALTLRLLGGLTVAEIAAAFLVPETTMAQRITRAKQKISGANIPYRVPARRRPARPARAACSPCSTWSSTRATSPASGDDPIRDDLTAEAIRLGRRAARRCCPTSPRSTGLLALMLLTDARRAARVADGELVPLHEQDRARWDRALIDEGHALVRECLRAVEPARATTSCWPRSTPCTPTRPTAADTDWAPDRGALRPAATPSTPTPGRRAQPGGRGRRARRARRSALAEVDRLDLDGVPRLARDPRRPAAPARPHRRGAGGVRRGARRSPTTPAERAYLTRRRGQLSG